MDRETTSIDRTREVHVIFRCAACTAAKRKATGKPRAVAARRVTFTVRTEGFDTTTWGPCGIHRSRSGSMRWMRDGAEVQRFPRTRPGVPTTECPGCGQTVAGAPVKGRFNEEIKCNARCTGATGHQCECSCGGKNHGAAHA